MMEGLILRLRSDSCKLSVEKIATRYEGLETICDTPDNPVVQRVRLTRNLALSLNGLDLSAYSIGQVLLVPKSQAAMLIAERWAETVHESASQDQPSPSDPKPRA